MKLNQEGYFGYFLYRTLLYEAEFTKHVMEHLVGKLAVTSKNSNRAIELLKGLGVFCTYQGVPIKKNQCKTVS